MRLTHALFSIVLMIMLALTGCTSSTPSGAPAPANNTNNNETPPAQPPQNNNGQQTPATEPANGEAQPAENGEEVKEKEVMLVFSDSNLMEQYKEPRTIKYKKEENLPTIALMAWQNGPQNKNLTSLIPKNVKIQSLKKEGDTAIVSLSPEIKQANLGSTGEQFLLEEMATILSQFGYKNMKVLVDGKEVETILGHMDTTTPVEPLKLNELKEMK
ncbi:GerMN domain-containing protein [Aneurinibacillus sp. UBA3580]|uniref:GerMN domain-containing protein n=1 Tax=Aneurinibacillus sp. UBA3580 TaxID=1946041 RepID=UPI00257C353A|nr:GerMN domain-containing protein [Aneurinibacillus sp. UBA3580]